MIILAVDPGEERTGFCMFKYNAETKKADLKIKTILNKKEEVFKTLQVAEGFKDQMPLVVICENFRVRPPDFNSGASRSRTPYGRSRSGSDNMFSWSEVPTIRIVGIVEYFAYRVGAEFVLQEPSILKNGRLWCDFPCPAVGHIRDDVSAYIHGAAYMMKKKMIQTTDDIIKFGQEKLSDDRQ